MDATLTKKHRSARFEGEFSDPKNGAEIKRNATRGGGSRSAVQARAGDSSVAAEASGSRTKGATSGPIVSSTGLKSPSQGKSIREERRPRQQERAIQTKRAILGAALREFARKGFDAASIRDIADRLGIQHPLITYHYKTKEALWQAVAEQVVGELREDFLAHTRNTEGVEPVDRVRELCRSLLSIEHKYPDLHHFMLNESRENGPRLRWLATNLLAPMVNTNLPDIRRAQATGDLPPGEPVMLHYMLIGMTSVLVSLGAEIEAVTGLSVKSPETKNAYFDLIDAMVFGRKFGKGELAAPTTSTKSNASPSDPGPAQ